MNKDEQAVADRILTMAGNTSDHKRVLVLMKAYKALAEGALARAGFKALKLLDWEAGDFKEI